MNTPITDDSPLMRQVVARILREAGFRDYQILNFNGPSQALQAVKADEPVRSQSGNMKTTILISTDPAHRPRTIARRG